MKRFSLTPAAQWLATRVGVTEGQIYTLAILIAVAVVLTATGLPAVLD